MGAAVWGAFHLLRLGLPQGLDPRDLCAIQKAFKTTMTMKTAKMKRTGESCTHRMHYVSTFNFIGP